MFGLVDKALGLVFAAGLTLLKLQVVCEARVEGIIIDQPETRGLGTWGAE